MSHLKLITLTLALSWLLPWYGVYGQERKIKPGDALEIVVYEHDELSQTVVVSPEGTVDSPFLEGIPVDDLTLERFKEILVSQLSRYMERTPVIKLRFAESYPIKVTVLGQVAKPGIYVIPNTVTIQGAIGEAGGAVAGAQLSQVKLIRGKHEETNTQAMHNGVGTQVVNMEKFFLDGDPGYLPALKAGDMIVVPGDPVLTSVKVMGSVNEPGAYDVRFRASLWDVIYLAGGPTSEANLSKVKVISPSGRNSREARYNIKGLEKSKSFETIPSVAPGDMVYVPQKAVTWKKFVSVVRDVTTFTTLYVIIRYGRRY